MIIVKEHRQSLFNEATYDVDIDVDLIYNKCFKNFVDNFKKQPISSFRKNSNSLQVDNYLKNLTGFMLNYMYTDELKSEESINTNVSIPIICGIFKEKNGYYPKGFILISLNVASIGMLIQNDFFNDDKIRKRVQNEISEHRIKMSIAHELSHWIDDYKYKLFSKLFASKDGLLLKKKSVDMTYFEIQGQIHAIKQVKRYYKEEYDKMTIDDLLQTYESLNDIAVSLLKNYGKEILDIWIKYLLKRMSRENLVGKNMNTSVDINKLLVLRV